MAVAESPSTADTASVVQAVDEAPPFAQSETGANSDRGDSRRSRHVGAPARKIVADSRWRGDIEGLRGVAIVAVVLYHADPRLMPGGFVGVDAFFVISGFLITRLLVSELETTGRISIPGFYARRVRRLLPALVVVVVATLVAAGVLLSPLNAARTTKDALASLFDVMNYRLALEQTNYLDAGISVSPLQHLWSLAVEDQMYLVWPLLLFISSGAWRRRRPSSRGPLLLLVVGSALSFIACSRLTTSNEPWAFFSFPTRAWELGVGALVVFALPALRAIPRSISALLGVGGLAALLVAAFRFPSATPWPGIEALLPVGGAVAIVIAGSGCRLPLSTRLLDNPPLRYVGRISYSWYLWHWPLLVLAPVALHHPLDTEEALGLVGASGVLATVSYLLIERPIHRSSWWARRARRGLSLGLGLTGVGVGACVACAAAVALPIHFQPAGPAAVVQRMRPGIVLSGAATALASQTGTMQRSLADPTNVAPESLMPSIADAYGDIPVLYQDGCVDTYTSVVLEPCAYGDLRGSKTVLLFGDSHAAMWFPAIEQAAEANSWRLFAWTKDTCPPIDLSLFSPDLGRAYTECTTWRDEVLAKIRVLHPALVILGVARQYSPIYGFTTYGQQWMDGLSEMVSTIRAMGSHVVVFGPIPKPAFDVPSCLSEHLDDVSACWTLRGAGVDLPGMRREERVVTTAGGSYVNTLFWFCNTDAVCPPIIDDMLIYRDDNHLTATFAASLARPVDAVLDLAMSERNALGSAVYVSPG